MGRLAASLRPDSNMTHSASSSPPRRLTFRLWIAAAVVVTASAFGGWGMWLYEAAHHEHPDPLSVTYHTLQLFILHAPHLEHPVNWQIHVGRLLSALFVFWAVIRGLTLLFRSELRLRWTRWWGGHVIICGLGRLGRQLAMEYQKNKGRVIVIEADSDKVALAGPRAVVVTGDACSADQLRKAGVTSAKQLIAVCDDVQTNVAIATTAGEVLVRDAEGLHSIWRFPQRVSAKLRTAIRRVFGCDSNCLTSWLFVPDAHLRQLLKRDGVFPHTGPRFHVNVRGLDLFSLAARQALSSNRLDHNPIRADSNTIVHLAIVGFGPMGQRLALQAARVGHFANLRKPVITVLGPSANPRADLFLSRYPKIKDLIDFRLRDFSYDAPNAAAEILKVFASDSSELATVALCWDSHNDSAIAEEELFRRLERDDAVNLRLALSMHQLEAGSMPRTLLYQTRRCGFATLLGNDGQASSWGAQVRVFGTLEETCSLDALLHESTDAVARALHEDWYAQEKDSYEKRLKKNPGELPKLAFQRWEQLDEIYKESNRHAADHIPVKMRAIGCSVEKLRDDPLRLPSLDAPEHAADVEQLAMMEHARWCAELYLMGYSYGPGRRDDTKRTHPDLVSWGALDESTKNYDRSQVQAIPKALARAGLGIYPDPSRQVQQR
jgi:TrkA-N domain/RyR domain